MAAIIGAFCCSVGNAQVIIYSNSFAGGARTINGTPPTVASNLLGGANTALWICTFSNSVSGYTNSVNGTVLANGTLGTNAGSVVMPFKPQSDAIYYLTASIYLPAANNWVGFGFCKSATITTNAGAERFTDSNVYGYPWMDARENVVMNFCGGPGTALESPSMIVEPTVGTYTLTIILNTLGPQWTTAGYVNGTIQGTNVVGGTQLGTNIVYGSNPTIGYVGPESGVKSAGFLRKWPKTRGFVKRVVQQSVNFQGIPIGVPMV